MQINFESAKNKTSEYIKKLMSDEVLGKYTKKDYWEKFKTKEYWSKFKSKEYWSKYAKKEFWLKFKSKRGIAIICIVLVIALLFTYCSKSKSVSGQIQTAQVSYGTVSKVIEGSGTIEAIDQYEVTALSIKGEVLECNFEEGDTVEEGQILYKIDASDMENSIEKAQTSLDKAQTSYNDTLKEYNETKSNERVKSPVSGVITSLNVDNGDKVNNGTSVAVVRNMSEMLLKIKFNSDDAKNMYIGQSARVSLQSSFSVLNGTVTRVGTGDIITDEGAIVRNVEIIVDNPGAIKEGDKATATVGSYACNSEGTFEYSENETITAKVSGEVYNLRYREGDYIAAGAVMFNIDSDYKESTLKNAQTSLKDAEDNLEKLNEDLEEYTITAPISGEIIQKNIKQGEKIDNSNSNEALAIIADLSTLVFDMSIDELDITSIEVGQKVEVSADAFEGEIFTGYVDKVSIVGTSQQGVTSYPVTVVVDSENKDKLIPGMNVSASIIIEERENVLVLPVSAVRRGNVVIAKTDSDGVGMPNMKAQTETDDDEYMPIMPEGEMPQNAEDERPQMSEGEMPKRKSADEKNTENNSKKQTENNQKVDIKDSPFLRNLEIPSGYKAIFVETGLSDDNFIEITAGLEEGDIVVLPDVTTTTTTTNMFGMPGGMPSGMPGGMGGGMPSGNMGARPGGMGGR